MKSVNTGVRAADAYVSRWRRGERLVHAALDGQLDVVRVHTGLLGVCGVDFGVLDDGRHVSCGHKRSVGDTVDEKSQTLNV